MLSDGLLTDMWSWCFRGTAGQSGSLSFSKGLLYEEVVGHRAEIQPQRRAEGSEGLPAAKRSHIRLDSQIIFEGWPWSIGSHVLVQLWETDVLFLAAEWNSHMHTVMSRWIQETKDGGPCWRRLVGVLLRTHSSLWCRVFHHTAHFHSPLTLC